MPDGVAVNESVTVSAGSTAAAGSARTRLVRRILHNRNVAIGGSVFVLLVLVALFADVLSPYNPTRLYPSERLKPPSVRNILGTDEFGPDIASLVLHGSRVLVQGTFIFAYAVLAKAILGFLGVGVPPYVPSWGNVIASGKNVIRQAFWVSAFPGVALTLAGLSLTLLGDGLRDTLDPRLRTE
jgi:ABC-type dipeptide/oligopeptide/nickel transport system permease subunit